MSTDAQANSAHVVRGSDVLIGTVAELALRAPAIVAAAAPEHGEVLLGCVSYTQKRAHDTLLTISDYVIFF